MKHLRILLLITNLGKGGAQRVVYDHAKALNFFFDVDEAVFDREEEVRLYNSGCILHDLKRAGLIERAGKLGRLLSRAIALRELVEKEKYDVVISHLDGANWVNILSFSSAKKITVLHGSILFDQGQSWFRRWFRINVLSRLIYDRADVTVSVSEGLSRELIDTCRLRNVITIRNFFEIKLIKESANEELSRSESILFSAENILITSGRLTPGKRQDELIKIISELKKRRMNVKLVILGDGESRKALIDLSKNFMLKTYDIWSCFGELTQEYEVYFLGYVSNPFKYLNKSTLFLFPSAWEGFPLALCEAIISGVAVVSSDCPTGPREILAPGSANYEYNLKSAEFAENGVLMPMIESKAELDIWVNTIEHLLSDRSILDRMRSNAAQSLHSLDRELILCKWRSLIEETANII